MSAAKQETRENGLKVLTIDGEADIRVGVLSALFSLRIMMRQVAHDCAELASSDVKANSSTTPIPEALPSKCFDLIVGSGDGGWVAIMLGRLGMSASEVIERYIDIRASIHDNYPYHGPQDHWQRDVMGSFFDTLLQLLVKEKVEHGASQEMMIEQPSCFTVALAMHGESTEPHPALFRNYVSRQGNMPNCPIWLVMRAAASSTIFPPAILASSSQKFLAASQFNFNNPVDAAISEAMELSKTLKISGSPISCLISLGSGHPGVESLCDSDLARVAIQLTMSATDAHEKAYRRFQDSENLDRDTYYRFNVDQGLQGGLLVHIKPGMVQTHTEAYHNKNEIKRLVDIAIALLDPETKRGEASRNVTSVPAHTSSSTGAERHSPAKSEPIRIYTKELYRLDLVGS
ncbi:hypothetical protein DL96DRAFT_261887 [Flagelloscypha sp. PMI_526]|nr:hypothetical protein DL96DRAFT_261887 [Flagelloscypha sp. PMI_526]